MRIYFINLDRSKGRRSWFERQMQTLDLTAVRVPAVDARTLPGEVVQRIAALCDGRLKMSPAEIACYLSHRRAWAEIIRSGDRWSFVAEDDIHLSPAITEFMQSEEWLPPHAELVKAETNLQRQEFSFQHWPAPEGHELRGLKSEHLGSGGYFLSAEAARRLLEMTERRCEPVDVLLFSPTRGFLNAFEVLQVSPALCIQDQYLPETAGFQAMASIIETERRENWDVRKTRLTKSQKIWREIRRLYRQFRSLIWRMSAPALGVSVFRRIQFREICR